jgi:hypothetical protein
LFDHVEARLLEIHVHVLLNGARQTRYKQTRLSLPGRRIKRKSARSGPAD